MCLSFEVPTLSASLLHSDAAEYVLNDLQCRWAQSAHVGQLAVTLTIGYARAFDATNATATVAATRLPRSTALWVGCAHPHGLGCKCSERTCRAARERWRIVSMQQADVNQ
jgi:hypothetical protein